MFYLDENMVQIWEEKRYDLIVLLNHKWRTRDEILKKGFKLFIQQVSREQLEALLYLKRVKTESEYEDCKNIIGNSLFQKLIKYSYLTEAPTQSSNGEIWHSQVGEHLHKYLKAMYGIDFPERPSRVLLLPTLRCAGNCIFCITDSKQNDEYQELDISDWRDITTRVCKELHPCSVDIVGGEPLTRFDLVLEMARVLSENNILVKIITNGLALANMERVNQLYEVLKNAKHNIQISLDGSRESHNIIRPGVDYDRVVKAVQNISKSGLTFGINLTVTKINLDNIEDLVGEMLRYGPSYILIGPLQMSPKNVTLCKDIMISAEEEKYLRSVVKKITEKHPNMVIKYDKEEPIYEKEHVGLGNNKEYHTCTAFIEEMSIGPEGHLISCLRCTAYPELWGAKITNEQSSFRDFWLFSEVAQRFRSIPLSGKCKMCDYNQQCNQGCPLETYILEGVLGGFDPHCTYIPKLT